MKSYNVKEIAELLHTNPETVRRWIRKGKLEATMGASRKEGNSVSLEALQKFLAGSPKYAAAAGAVASPPAALASIGAIAAGAALAAKLGYDNAIENASMDALQIVEYIDNESKELEESIARKRETVKQLTQEIEKDERRLEELGKILDQLEANEAGKTLQAERSSNEEEQEGEGSEQ